MILRIFSITWLHMSFKLHLSRSACIHVPHPHCHGTPGAQPLMDSMQGPWDPLAWSHTDHSQYAINGAACACALWLSGWSKHWWRHCLRENAFWWNCRHWWIQSSSSKFVCKCLGLGKIWFTTPSGSSTVTPFSHNSKRSSTSGRRKSLISCFGLFGPGKIPTRNTFFILYLSLQGRFRIVMYMAPTEYCRWLYGWNQSTFNCKTRLLGVWRNDSQMTLAIGHHHTHQSIEGQHYPLATVFYPSKPHNLSAVTESWRPF